MATADVIDNKVHRHGTSDELIDPWCDLCHEETNKKIDATGFCVQCNTFLCKQCLGAHKRFPAMENHKILQGGRMPKTQADRPVKYLDCDIHKGNVNDHFCIDHGKMACNQCITESHKSCKQQLIPDLCKNLSSVDIQDFRNVTEKIKKNVTSVINTLEKNKDNIGSDKIKMLKEAKELRDKLILKIENAYSSTVSDINKACAKQVSHLSSQVSALSDMIASLDQTLSKIDKIIGIDISPHVFIKLQNMATKVCQNQTELAELEKQLRKIDLSFFTIPEISAFLSANNPLGSVKEVSSQLDLRMPTPDIAFPSPSRKRNKSKSWAGRIVRDITHIKATKMTPLNMKMADEETCVLTRMAITRNNILLLADWNNNKVKAVSLDKKLLSSLTLSAKPYAITVIDEITAAASTNDKKLHILDISDPGSLVIQRSVSLRYWVSSLAPCNTNLVVTKWTEPRCVKLITLTGAKLWSVSTDHNGQQLFKYPHSVTTNIINDNLTVIVTDWGKNTITLLDANNGDVIKIVDVKGKGPYGLTVGNDGNVYVCYRSSGEMCVWSADFSQSRILLSDRDLQPNLMNIIYCDNTDEIFICYEQKKNTVDRFKLS